MPRNNDRLDFAEDQLKNEQLVKEKAQAIADSTPVDGNTYPQANTTVSTQPAEVLPVTPQPTPQAPVIPSRADEIMQQLFTRSEPKPVVDEAKMARLEKMGKINGIGQNLNVLGDIFGLAIGANVRKRQPDRVAPAIYQQYEQMMDQNKADQDAWKNRDYQRGEDNLKMGYSVAVRKEAEAKALELRKQQLEQELEIAKANNDYKKAKDLQAQLNFETTAKETANYHRAMVNKKSGSGSGKDKTIKIRTDKQEYEISESEYSYDKGRALKNLDLLQKKFPSWFVTTPKLDQWDEPIPGEFTTKLDPRVKDDDLVREQKILDEEEAAAKQPEADTSPVMLRGVGKQPTTPDISEADYAKLKKGDKFFFGGKQLIKQ